MPKIHFGFRVKKLLLRQIRAAVRILYLFDLDGVGVAGAAVDGAAGENHIVAGLQVQNLLCIVQGVVEHDVHGGELLGDHGRHAPAHGEAAPDFPVGGHADNIHGGAEAADQHGSLAGNGADHDALGIQVDGHGADNPDCSGR